MNLKATSGSTSDVSKNEVCFPAHHVIQTVAKNMSYLLMLMMSIESQLC